MPPAPGSRKKAAQAKVDTSEMSTEEVSGGKAVPKGDASDATTAAEMEPPKSSRRLRHTDSELSSTDLEEMDQASGKGSGKRFKPGSPKSRRAGAGVAAAAAVAAAPVVRLERLSDVVAAASGAVSSAAPRPHSEVIKSAKAITQEMMEVVLLDGVDPILAKKVLENAAKFEALIFNLMADNERVRGKLEVLEAGNQPVFKTPAVPVAVQSTSRRVPVAPAAPVAVNLPKPVETWSVVVKGKKGVTSKEVVEKVVTEVGPTLGVRVHELRPLRSGGAVIRTPSVAEREKVAANEKFGEVGLEVSVNDKLGPKVVVQRVHSEITPDEFMRELYDLNFRRRMTPEAFKSTVRMVSAPWKSTGGPVSVVLEGSGVAMQQLLDNGRCYIKWFSFLVRPHDAVPSCFRCLGFDHRVKECRMTEGVCRLCGQVGHMASRCVNEINCRNCAFKGLPANHLMMSAACPVYSAMIARANARH